MIMMSNISNVSWSMMSGSKVMNTFNDRDRDISGLKHIGRPSLLDGQSRQTLDG